MNELADCLAIYQRLISLLEEEELTIAQAVKGDVLDHYRQLLKEEKDMVLRGKNELRNQA